MSPDSLADRYHRRRRSPILVVIAVLLIGTGVAWFQVLKPVPAASTGCNQPGPAPKAVASTTRSTTGSTARMTGGTEVTARSTASNTPSVSTTKSIRTSLGSFANPGSLTGIRPADPATVAVQVYNASQTSGLAKTVTNDLRAAGFTSILAGANDPLYPAFDLVCVGEIRYGQAGTAAARTMLMIAPCAQLVLDNRISDSVDLSIGARYQYAPPPDTVKAQLKAIHDAAIPPAVIEGQTARPRPPAVIPALPSVSCA